MRLGKYTQVILTIIAAMLMVIAINLSVISRKTTLPNNSEFWKQVGEDQVALAKRVAKQADERQQAVAKPEASQPPQVTERPPATPQQTAAQHPPEAATQSGSIPYSRQDEHDKFQAWDKAFHAVLDQQNAERARLKAEQSEDAARPLPDRSIVLPEVSQCLGPTTTIGEPTPTGMLRINGVKPVPFLALTQQEVENTRRGHGPPIKQLPDSIPAGSRVTVIVDPRRDPQNGNYIAAAVAPAGNSYQTFYLVRVDDGRIGYMKQTDFEHTR